MDLARRLHAEGARLLVADAQREAVDRAVAEFGAKPVDSDEHHHRRMRRAVAQCARRTVLDDRTIPRVKAAIVAGAANKPAGA